MSEARGTENDREEKGAERVSQRDGVGLGVTVRHELSNLIAKANLSQPSDETGKPSKGRDGLGHSGKFDLV